MPSRPTADVFLLFFIAFPTTSSDKSLGWSLLAFSQFRFRHTSVQFFAFVCRDFLADVGNSSIPIWLCLSVLVPFRQDQSWVESWVGP